MSDIKGYRKLDEDEIEVINSIKMSGNNIGKMIEILENNKSTDKRWVATGKTDIQKGLMSLVRSIAKPEGF